MRSPIYTPNREDQIYLFRGIKAWLVSLNLMAKKGYNPSLNLIKNSSCNIMNHKTTLKTERSSIWEVTSITSLKRSPMFDKKWVSHPRLYFCPKPQGSLKWARKTWDAYQRSFLTKLDVVELIELYFEVVYLIFLLKSSFKSSKTLILA